MWKIIKFLKESFIELRYKISWASSKELEHFATLFCVNVVLWTSFLYGLNWMFSWVQVKVYSWM